MISTFDSKVRKPSSLKNSASKVDTTPTPQIHTDLCDVKIPNKSKNGCLTCKIRKKKCNEQRPTCDDCKRLNKDCVWVDYKEMSKSEIRQLKEKVEAEEGHRKLRKRKPKSLNSQIPVLAALGLMSEVSREPPHIEDIPERVFYNSKRPRNGPTPNLEDVIPYLTAPLSPLTFETPNRKLINELPHNLSHDVPHISDDLPHISQEIPQDLTKEIRANSPVFSPAYTKELTPNVFPFNETPPVSPSAFLSFLKDISQYQHTQDCQNDEGISSDIALIPSPSFSMLMETFDFNDPAMADMIPDLNSLFTPMPTPFPNQLPELSKRSAYLYNYYVEELSKKISIAPVSQFEANSYQSVFLPLARKDDGILYAILGWAGHALGGEWKKEGQMYLQKALKHLRNSSLPTSTDFYDRRVTDGELLNQDRHSVIIKLATILILCAAEICKGDVKNWSIVLDWGWKLLYSNGGILKYNKLKEEHWLISNFAYHDLLASSSSERGTYFPPQDYDIIFKDQAGFSKGNLNSLLGVSKILYRIIGDISTLVFESNKALKEMYLRRANQEMKLSTSDVLPLDPEFEEMGSPIESESSELSEHSMSHLLLNKIIGKARDLDLEIDVARPESSDLEHMTEDEKLVQITLFTACKLSAKLYLKQCVMKCNPTMLEMQVLNADLLKCIDDLIGTAGQASLVFPLFMSGIHCVTPTERIAMLKRIDKLMEDYGTWNVKRMRYLMEKVWEKNFDGSKVVDWHLILRELGWDVNFG